MSARRIKAELTDVRWFDVDEDALRAFYGDDIPEDLGSVVQEWLLEGDGFPSWLVEIRDKRDFYSTTEAFYRVRPGPFATDADRAAVSSVFRAAGETT